MNREISVYNTFNNVDSLHVKSLLKAINNMDVLMIDIVVGRREVILLLCLFIRDVATSSSGCRLPSFVLLVWQPRSTNLNMQGIKIIKDFVNWDFVLYRNNIYCLYVFLTVFWPVDDPHGAKHVI
jgi:hypothetical protein